MLKNVIDLYFNIHLIYGVLEDSTRLLRCVIILTIACYHNVLLFRYLSKEENVDKLVCTPEQRTELCGAVVSAIDSTLLKLFEVKSQ